MRRTLLAIPGISRVAAIGGDRRQLQVHLDPSALVRHRIGVLDVPYHVAMLRLYLPQAEIMVLQSPREFLAGEGEALDAMLFPAQSAAAWSLVYPRFSVAIPQPDVVSAPVAYPVARDDLQMAAFLSNWVELQRKDGTIEALHDHWILGDATKNRGPRWSVIRDVLGWVE